MTPRVKSIINYRQHPNNATSYFKNDEVIKITTNNQLRLPLLLIALFTFIAAPTRAQSPNTSTMIVDVVDQAGAVVKDAKVLVVNTATGAVREVVSGSDGSATTGVDNNGDGVNNNRPVINGIVISKSAFRGTPTSEVALFIENRIKMGDGFV
jgi:hypothetical protein